MKIPKTINKNDREYTFIKEYKYFVLYKERTGYKECFNKHELGLIAKQGKVVNINPGKVKI